MNTGRIKQDFKRSPLFRKALALLEDKSELIEFLQDHENAIAAQTSLVQSFYKMPDGTDFILGNQHYSALLSYILKQEDQELDLYHDQSWSEITKEQCEKIFAFEKIMSNLEWEKKS